MHLYIYERVESIHVQSATTKYCYWFSFAIFLKQREYNIIGINSCVWNAIGFSQKNLEIFRARIQ